MNLLSIAYFPPLEWMHYFLKSEDVKIEKYEHFVKQTYRNRCEIATANGKLALTIPLINEGNKTLIADKKISYAEPWQIKHWRAIESAYQNSPYFEYFEAEVKEAILFEEEFLLKYNHRLLQYVLDILRLSHSINYTDHYENIAGQGDHRYSISPKEESKLVFPEYYQVFKLKTGFIKNLSVLDLLFNEGLRSVEYLDFRH